MLSLGPTTLPFLGKRTYLHSTDVFRYFWARLAALPPDARPVHLASFKFLRETDRNGIAYLLDKDEPLPAEAGRPAATLVFRDAGHRWRRLELTDDGAPIGERAAEPASQCELRSLAADFEGSVVCRHSSAAGDLFYALVEANKLMHVETLRRRGEEAARPFRFVYCEELPLEAINRAHDNLQFEFRHRGARVVDGRVYTLNVIRIDGIGALGARLCFAY